MRQKQTGVSGIPWLGTSPAATEVPGSPTSFNEGRLWFGRHAVDDDMLVFDPAESDPLGEKISLYSLTQHRMRTFPRAMVLRHIQGVTDDITLERARRNYEERDARRREHEVAAAAAQADRAEEQRQGVLAAHARYLAELGLEDAGVIDTPANHKSGRRTRCHACGITLDDFTRSICGRCRVVLCSCGACACSAAASSRPEAS